ncbi:MAG: hypothetical protein RLZZ507_3018 [Cyanobacteriota bacterium]|jgi:hypothetical protein
MKRFSLLAVPLVTFSLLLCHAMNANKSLSQPAAIDLVNAIPDGNHRFCSQQPKTTNVAPPDAIIGNCFLFRKTGNQVVGAYYDTRTLGEESLCLQGRLSDRLVGEGLELIGGIGRQSIPAKAEGSDLVNWDQEGILKVSNAVRFGKRTLAGQQIRYRQAILDLKQLYRYNLGNKLPPTRCIR